MAQAVHGTAPDIAGKGVANPISEILSGVMLLDWLFSHKGKDKTLFDTARVIENSLFSQLASGDIKERTFDLGGNASTRDFTHGLVRRIESK
jgi:3-isopropylmalate dehydrogenase